MRIDVRKLSAKLYEVSLNGEVLCQSETPLFSAARILMSRGVDPKTELIMARLGSNRTLMRARLGAAAELTVVNGGLPAKESPAIVRLRV
jgi:hypothetical protein